VTQPQTIHLPAVYVGTTWEGINSIGLDQPNGQAFNLTGAALRMVYRRVGEQQERLVLTVGSGITITNAAEGRARVDEQILPLTPGTYYWELLVTQANGVVLPVFAGTQEITRIGVSS
jgi:hypothetical protein